MVIDLTRREFIALNASVGLAALVPWLENARLSDDDRHAMVMVARTMFPHDRAPDHNYLRAVARLDARCGNNAALSYVVRNGLAVLQSRCGQRFTKLEAGARVAVLMTMSGTLFFRTIYGEVLEGLYGPADSWGLFVTGV
jgi:hypothetical protein